MNKKLKVFVILLLFPLAIGIWYMVLTQGFESFGLSEMISFGSNGQTPNSSSELSLDQSNVTANENASTFILIFLLLIFVLMIGLIVYFSRKQNKK